MFQNICCMCWNKYVDKLEQKLKERFLPPVPVSSSKEDIDELANKVHSVITKPKKAACLMQKFCKKDNIWWSFELASLRKEACCAWRKTTKTKQEEDWVAQKLGQAYFKKAGGRAKHDLWHRFVESVNSQTPTALC